MCNYSLQSQDLLPGTITYEGIERNYLLYVPEIYISSSAVVPLVFNFHGYTSNAIAQATYGNFRQIADRENFLIVHPQGTMGDDGQTFWNAQWVLDGPDDIGFTAALIDSLSVTYNIDQQRIYSTGMSNGGFMSYTLACELSDRIAAIASVTGTMTRDQIQRTCDPENVVPIMEIHGTNDGTVPYEGNQWMAPIEDVMGFWRDRYSCSDAELIQVDNSNMTDGSTVEHQVNSDCVKMSSIELFKVIGGGHTWPGTSFNFGSTNYDIDASEEIWRFFSQYNIDGLISNTSEVKYLQEFKLYPTLSNDIITLELPEQQIESSITIRTLTGESLRQLSSPQKTTIIKIDTLPQGIYLVTLASGRTVVTKKFIKL